MPDSFEGALYQYRLLRRLGAGGMGEVFLAQDTSLDRLVALKLLSPALTADEASRTRFRTEAKAAAGLAHPNICVIYEVGETAEGRPFVAMEYVQGETLDQLMKNRRLGIREVLCLGQELSEAMEAAHAGGIIHRDIKPSNIILDARWHAKLLDFGLAKRVEVLPRQEAPETALTQSGAIMGTPYYMSPEQALGHQADRRTDIFSLGAVLYELVTGQRPFAGDTVGEVLNSLINQPPAPLGLENPLYSPALDQVVFKCLEKAPENRYATAGELAAALAQLRQDAEHASPLPATASSSASLRAGRPPVDDSAGSPGFGQRLRVRTLALAVAGLVLALGAVALFFRPGWWGIPRSGLEQTRSVAVLPFDNISRDPGTEYLSDGLTEEITTALGRIRGLKVAARTSASALKARNADARSIARTLKVRTILTGSVRQDGRQLRVNAELVNAADGFQLWSDTYDRSVDDIISVQEDIASRIAERLQAGSAQARGNRKNPSPKAHRLYLQARHFWNERTEFGLTNAIQFFRAALEQEPAYAEAHSGLAATYLVFPNYAPVPRAQYLTLARTAAERALQLDAASAEAHAVFAELEWASRQLPGAEEHFRRALELAPNSPTVHHWYGQFLTTHGRPAEGLAQLQAAVELDPLSPIIRTTIPQWHHMTGDNEGALREAREVIRVFPNFPVARLMLSYAYISEGRFPEALEELERARRIEPADPLRYLDVSAYALARSGQESGAREILARYEALQTGGKSVDHQLALIYVGLREYKQAIEAFGRIAATDVLEDVILCDPFYQELLPLPAFQNLLRNAGIKPTNVIQGASPAAARR